MDNQVFSVSQEVDKETPILSALITPSTPKSTSSFGPLQLDLTIDNTSPNDNAFNENNRQSKMSSEVFKESDAAELSPKMSGRRDTKAVRPSNLRLHIPQTPASPEPTPTQDRNGNEVVMSRRLFDFKDNSGHHQSCGCEGVANSKRHMIKTQESVHDPEVSLLHGQIDSSVCNNTHCVKCGKTLQEEDLNRHRNHKEHFVMDIPDNCDINSTSINSCNLAEDIVMNKSQSKNTLLSALDEQNDAKHKHSIVQYSNKPNSCCHCFRNAIMLILLVLLCIAVSFIVCYFVFIKHPTNSLLGLGGNNTVCVPCSSLRLTSDPSDDHTKLLAIRGDQCCANSPQQIEQIIEAIAERQVRTNEVNSPLRHYQPYTNQSKNMYAAHVYLGEEPVRQRTTTISEYEDEYEDDSHYDIAHEYYILKGWTKSPSTAFVRKGIVFLKDKGRFRVTREGIYKVYSHLSVNKPDGEQDVGVVFSQRIFRENIKFTNAARKVLEDTQVAPCPNIPTNHACHSSTLDSLLSLRNGDEIFVSVTHPELLSTDKISSFFGIYRVD